MPPVPNNERWAAWLNWIGFWLCGVGMKSITWVFFLGDLLMTGRLLLSLACWLFTTACARQPLELRRRLAAFRPKVALLIPAYNEEKVIERTVRSALDSDLSQPAGDRDRRWLEGPTPLRWRAAHSRRKKPKAGC